MLYCAYEDLEFSGLSPQLKSVFDKYPQATERPLLPGQSGALLLCSFSHSRIP